MRKSKKIPATDNLGVPKKKAPLLPRLLPPPTGWFKNAPDLSDKALRVPFDDLTRTLMHLDRGDVEIIKNARRPGIGTTARGLAGEGHPFLSVDRLTWWDAYFDNSEKRQNGPIKQEEFFASEFSGSGSQVTWDAMPLDSDANNHPNIPFFIYSSEPGHRPRVVHRTIQSDDESGTLKPGRASRQVVILEAPEGYEQEPGKQRPHLVIHFDEPQRAVGLSFGFDSDLEDGLSIASEYCRLIAYKSDGTRITESTAGQLPSGRQNVRQVPAGHGAVHIGVTSREAEICYVELEFSQFDDGIDGNPPTFIPYPQLISRVWYEPFPPCVVKQDSLSVVSKSNQSIIIRKSFDIPYHCDRALVALRGFGLKFMDAAAEIKGLSVGAAIDSFTEESFRVTGTLEVQTEEALDIDVRVDLALLAWESSRMDLSVGNAYNINGQTDPETPNPCALDGATCTEFSSLLKHFKFSNDEYVEVDELTLISHQPFPSGTGSTMSWQVDTVFDGADEDSLRTMAISSIIGGTSMFNVHLISTEVYEGESSNPNAGENLILTGPTLFKGEMGAHFRQKGTYFKFFGDETSHPVGVALQADMCMLALGEFSFFPEDEIHQIDVEVFGQKFDGEQFFFQFGIGTATDPEATDDLFPWGVGMQLVGLKERKKRVRSIRVQDVVFDRATPNAISLAPSQVGMIINDGPDPLVITDLHVEGAGADRFRLIGAVLPTFQATEIRNLGFSPQSFHLEEFNQRSPVIVHAGEKLLIGGAVFPTDDHDLSMTLVAVTNDALHPTLNLSVTASVVPSQAQAEPLPHSMDFGQVPVGQTRSKNLLLASIGVDPLLLSAMTLESHTDSFKYELVNSQFEAGSEVQLEPGEVWPAGGRIVISANPTQLGEISTNFKFTTNAGEVLVPIKVAGV